MKSKGFISVCRFAQKQPLMSRLCFCLLFCNCCDPWSLIVIVNLAQCRGRVQHITLMLVLCWFSTLLNRADVLCNVARNACCYSFLPLFPPPLPRYDEWELGLKTAEPESVLTFLFVSRGTFTPWAINLFTTISHSVSSCRSSSWRLWHHCQKQTCTRLSGQIICPVEWVFFRPTPIAVRTHVSRPFFVRYF